jgi:hypothetical protein
MTMIRGRQLAAGLICAACGSVAIVATSGAEGAVGPSQIRITDVQVSDRIARPLGGGHTGTVELIRQRLYNPTISERSIGRSLLVCTFSDGPDRSCVATYILPKGNLVTTGALQSRLLYEIPVVGGTGLYDNARGTLTVTATHLHPRHEVLFFRLVG